jgi:hypothetical protein
MREWYVCIFYLMSRINNTSLSSTYIGLVKCVYGIFIFIYSILKVLTNDTSSLIVIGMLLPKNLL